MEVVEDAPAGPMAWPGVLVGWMVSGGMLWRHRWVGWSVLVGFLTVCAVVFSRVERGRLPVGAAVTLAVLATAPLLLVRRYPGLVLGLVVAANVAFTLVARSAWPVAAGVGLAARDGRVRAAAVAVVGGALALAAGVVVPLAAAAAGGEWRGAVAVAAVLLLSWGAGDNVRSRRISAGARAAAAAELRELHDGDAVARGRAGVARDLHDVVAHHVSLIAVRAGTAAYQVPDASPAARELFAEIAADARSALQELRTVAPQIHHLTKISNTLFSETCLN